MNHFFYYLYKFIQMNQIIKSRIGTNYFKIVLSGIIKINTNYEMMKK